MRKQTLLQRLVAGLATNEGVQSKPTEIWRRLKRSNALNGQIRRPFFLFLECERKAVSVQKTSASFHELVGIRMNVVASPMFDLIKQTWAALKHQHYVVFQRGDLFALPVQLLFIGKILVRHDGNPSTPEIR